MAKKASNAKADYPTTIGPNKDYMAEDDARSLTRAGEIMADPKRCAAAKKCMAKQMAAMSKMAGMGGKGAKYPDADEAE